MASFVLFFFPLDVLDGIWDLIESVSEGFLTYSCKDCNFNCIANEFHFLSQFSLYETERAKLYSQVHHKNNNFMSLCDNDKARWLLLQEDRDILSALGTYIQEK